jgi:uncharacterized membrane protein YbhN (UPF0104 family)
MKRELAAQRRTLVAGALFNAVGVAVAVAPQLLGAKVTRAFAELSFAKPAWLWLAALLTVATLVAWAQAWRAVVLAVGGTVTPADATARYTIGSGINTFLPARLGDIARIALFSRALGHRERTWTTAGVYTSVGAARALWCGALIVIGYLAGALPLWTILVCGALVAVAVAASVVARRRGGSSRLAHFFDAYRDLGRNPRRAARVVGWSGIATATRVAAAAAIVSALGLHHALAAALLIVPTLDAASLLPLTPGGLGLSSGAVAVTLHEIGISGTNALSVGIACHAVEAAAGLVCGAVGALVFAGERRPLARRAGYALAAVAVAVAFAGTFGIAFPDLA